jgi:hypothetical protein
MSCEQLTIQPQLPLPLDADWNLIVRSLLPVTLSPDPQRRFGLGDVQPSFFLTPARSTGLIWGAGPAFQFPPPTMSWEPASGRLDRVALTIGPQRQPQLQLFCALE